MLKGTTLAQKWRVDQRAFPMVAFRPLKHLPGQMWLKAGHFSLSAYKMSSKELFLMHHISAFETVCNMVIWIGFWNSKGSEPTNQWWWILKWRWWLKICLLIISNSPYQLLYAFWFRVLFQHLGLPEQLFAFSWLTVSVVHVMTG